MPKIEIIEETPLNLHEIKEKIQEIKKRDKELNFRANKAEEYLNIITKTKLKKPKDLEKDLKELQIQRLKTKQIKKIIDLQPIDLDSIKTILSSENLTIKQEELQKIIDTVKKHV